jgi:hypothetical protein
MGFWGFSNDSNVETEDRSAGRRGSTGGAARGAAAGGLGLGGGGCGGGGGAAGISAAAVSDLGEHFGHSLYEGGTSPPHLGQIHVNMRYLI